MSAIYDNWERLVGAVLKKEQLWQLFHSDSLTVSSPSSAFSLSSSLDDAPPSSISKEVDYTHSEKRDLNNELPKQQSYPLPLPPNSASQSLGSPWKKGKLLGVSKVLFGGVYLGFNSENGGMCAMKEVPLSPYGDVKQREYMLKKDIPQLSRMRHPNIVKYYGSEMVADNFYIYYEYMSRGTIHSVLEQYGRLGESVISSYTQQILSGLVYLHSNRIAHRGIEVVNILIDAKGIVKLSNFGIEKQIAERLDASRMMDNPCWVAPEVRRNPNICNLAVDIWNLGCTVLQMATSKRHLNQYDEVKAVPAIPDHLSHACKDFIRHCLRWDPSHRATAARLLEHPFVKGFSPLGDRMLFSVTNFVNLEGIEEKLDKVKVVSSTSDFRPSDQRTFPQSSPSPTCNTPYYWDPNILQRIFT